MRIVSCVLLIVPCRYRLMNNVSGLKICNEKGQMVPEDRFEIQGDVDHGRTGAPTKARKYRDVGVGLYS